jgi:RNA 2',3'-cyclic 3'-phosphodiesterase
VSPPAGQGARTLRLFFALWPDARMRAGLASAAAATVGQVAGQAVPPGNLHVTLAFLGPVAGQALLPLFDVGGQGPWPPVDLRFERIEYWAKPRVLVAMPTGIPSAGLAIVERLWTRLEPLGYTREARPWRPHLTLARRIRRPPPDNLVLGPVECSGDEPPWRLALVDSMAHAEGPRYKPLADWPLEGDGHL